METTAYHEAGHALVAIMLGGEIKSVTIDPDRDEREHRYGDTAVLWRMKGRSDREYREHAIQVALAGPVAEMLYTGDPFHPGLVPEWAADWADAWELAAVLKPVDRERLAYLEQISIRLYRLLDSEPHWSALAEIADNLLAHETLEGEQVHEIVGQWLR